MIGKEIRKKILVFLKPKDELDKLMVYSTTDIRKGINLDKYYHSQLTQTLKKMEFYGEVEKKKVKKQLCWRLRK